jgi:hypothetical protein
MFYPLKKDIFYSNDERLEEFIYTKINYPIVIVGSSLSIVFDGKSLFKQPSFDLCFPLSGACTGIETIKRINKIPSILLVEINHIDRGEDSLLIKNIFSEPLFSLKQSLPILLKKNQILHNVIDRFKTPQNNIINSQKPPAILYNSLLASAQKDCAESFNIERFKKNFLILKENLDALSKKGCIICFYELPMDSSLYKSPLLVYERNSINKLAAEKGYKCIEPDTSRNYNTGDGAHLLRTDGDIYIINPIFISRSGFSIWKILSFIKKV